MRTVDFDAAVNKHRTIIPELLAATEIEDCAQEGPDPSALRAFPSEAEALGAQNKLGRGLVGQKDGYVRLGFGALPEARFLAVPVIRAIDQAAQSPLWLDSVEKPRAALAGRGWRRA